MSRTLVLLAVAVLVCPATGIAKEPSKASVEGPGLSEAITLSGDGEAATRLGSLTQQAGFPAAVFGHRDPDPMLRSRPGGNLGPKYTITYTVPGPDNDVVQLRQDVYPYAQPTPVTYLRPRQEFFRGITTYGGWFRASPHLKETLVSAGLPARPFTGSSGDSFFSTGVIGALAAGTALLGAAVVPIARRRRVRHAPAS